jgi:hypothetical protein
VRKILKFLQGKKALEGLDWIYLAEVREWWGGAGVITLRVPKTLVIP